LGEVSTASGTHLQSRLRTLDSHAEQRKGSSEAKRTSTARPSLALILCQSGIASHARCSSQSLEQLTAAGYATADKVARTALLVPAGQWGQPDDAGRLVAWLTTDEAEWMTGQVIASDGGWSTR